MIDRKDNHIDADINQGLEDIYLVSPRPDFLPGLGSILTLKAKEKIGEDNKKNFFPRTSRKPLFALVSFVLVVILFTLFTSPGQTFAQQILHFFYPTNDQTHPVATASLSNDESTRLAIQAAKLAESCPQNELERTLPLRGFLCRKQHRFFSVCHPTGGIRSFLQFYGF